MQARCDHYPECDHTDDHERDLPRTRVGRLLVSSPAMPMTMTHVEILLGIRGKSQERDRQHERKTLMLQAIRERRWEDVKAALLVLYDPDSEEYRRAIAEIRAFDPSAQI